jgi:uncharacterized membrane protein (DUF441 family)
MLIFFLKAVGLQHLAHGYCLLPEDVKFLDWYSEVAISIQVTITCVAHSNRGYDNANVKISPSIIYGQCHSTGEFEQLVPLSVTCCARGTCTDSICYG